MTKTRHKRTAVASMFQNSISRNAKCAKRDDFCREGHICIYNFGCGLLTTCTDITLPFGMTDEHL